MGYRIVRLKDIKPKRITCGVGRELTTKIDFENASFLHAEVRGETKKHYHKKLTEFYFVLRGKVELELGGKKERLGKGDLAIIPSGVKHKAKGNADVLAIDTPAWSADDEFVVE